MPSNGNKGQQRPNSSTSEFNSVSFLVRQILANVHTAKLVIVINVAAAGEVAPVGFIDVKPLVNQIDGDDQAIEHGTIYNIPYFRLQGGTDAIILDPKVGDIGLCLFSDRDISTVKATKAQANPGSKRRFDMADGVYIGGILNGIPAQYIQFIAGGINIISPTKIRLQAPDIEFVATDKITSTAPNIEMDASTKVTANTPEVHASALITGANATITGTVLATTVTASGTVTGTSDVVSNGKSLKGHVHSGVQRGTDSTNGPT